MEANKNLFWNKAMFWGFITALLSMISTTIHYSTNNMFSKSNGWLSIMILVLGIVICGIMYRRSIAENDEFPYSKALGLGVATAFFASLILALFTFVLYKYIDPDLVEQSLTNAEEVLLEKGINEDLIETQIEMQRNFVKPSILSASTVLTDVIYGLIISLVTSIFLRKKAADGFSAAMSEIDDED